MSDSPVIAFLNKMTDIIILNLLFLLCCIPIVTIGVACTALYHVSILSIRLGDGYVVKRFFTSFKNDFKQATILWLLLLLISAFLGWDIFFWSQLGNDMGKVMICLSTAVWLVVAVISLYLFPVLSKLEGSLWMTIRNAAAFAVGYLYTYFGGTDRWFYLGKCNISCHERNIHICRVCVIGIYKIFLYL